MHHAQHYGHTGGSLTMTKIHPTALVDPKASLEAGVEIGPYSIIGPDVVIGAGLSG